MIAVALSANGNGSREDLDHGAAAGDLHHLGAAGVPVLLVLAAFHRHLVPHGFLVAGRVLPSGLVLLVGDGGALRVADRQVVQHPEHLVGVLAHRAVGLVSAGAQIERQRGGGAGLDLGRALLEAAALDFERMRDRARVGHFEDGRPGRNPGGRKLDFPFGEADLDRVGRGLLPELRSRRSEAGDGEDDADQAQRTGEADDAVGASLRNGVHAVPPSQGWDVSLHRP